MYKSTGYGAIYNTPVRGRAEYSCYLKYSQTTVIVHDWKSNWLEPILFQEHTSFLFFFSKSDSDHLKQTG